MSTRRDGLSWQADMPKYLHDLVMLIRLISCHDNSSHVELCNVPMGYFVKDKWLFKSCRLYNVNTDYHVDFIMSTWIILLMLITEMMMIIIILRLRLAITSSLQAHWSLARVAFSLLPFLFHCRMLVDVHVFFCHVMVCREHTLWQILPMRAEDMPKKSELALS